MSPPAADLDVDLALVRRLLAAQHPDLADLPLRLVASGWDNAVFRLGPDLAVRVPRRQVAAHLLGHEQEVLPLLAPRLPVPVPLPVRVGVPGADFAWPWSVVPWFRGRPAAGAGLRDDVGLALSLGRFVQALHRPAPASAPPNPVRGVPLADRAEAVAERLATGRVPQAARAEALWAEALAAPRWAGPPLWLHGDLHPANLLVRDGRLVAVLDFGDVTAGDPATDLATAWLSSGPRPRAELHRLLGPDDATWVRARGWALAMATAMLATGEPGSVIHRVGAETLAEVLGDAA